jgi:hypothetical protein
MAQFRRIKVFISYSHSDGRQVAAIRQFLPLQLFDVYFDRNRLQPGWQWEPILLNMIRDADVFALMVGADTMDREYVNKEVDTFLEIHGASKRGLIPVLIDGCHKIPVKLSAFQALDLRGTDARSRARSIAQAIHGAFYVPTTEIAQSGRGPSQLPDPSAGEELSRLWEAGQIGASPHVLAQMVNLGVARMSIQCSHCELDMITMAPKQCEAPAVVVCVSCNTGSCETAFHLYGRFCTLIPPGDMFSRGTKMFYWCGTCRGPVCARCLDIEDDYPCPPHQVLSFRFLCPVCSGHVQVVPVLDTDMDRVSTECLRWARAGGPPDVQNS